MINKNFSFKKIVSPYNSEKASSIIEKNNSIVFKVFKNATKSEIRSAIYEIFKLKVSKIRTLIVKGKRKKHKKYIGYRKDWKKAYIFLKGKYNIDSIIEKNKLFLREK